MRKDEKQELQIHAKSEEFEQAQDFVEELLGRLSISSQIALETQVVFEAMLGLILMQGFDRDTVLTITGERLLGDFSIKIGFDGKRFSPSEDGEDGSSPELKIVEGFGEKVSHSYHHGHNTVRISVRATPEALLVSCGGGFLLSIVAYLVICLMTDADTQRVLLNDYLQPVESLFGNALLMVGPPVTLLSLLKNVTNVFIASERSTDAQRLWVKAIATSCFAIGLAIVTFLVASFLITPWRGYYAEYTTEVVDHSFAALVSSAVPASIFEPFEAISPIPLIVLAIIVTYALCHASTHFDKLKTAIDALCELFSWMLRAVMVVLPFFCFVAFLDVLLDQGFASLLYIASVVLAISGGVLLLFASYAVRLRVKGIHVRRFAKTLLPLLRENIAINSSIDAVPYNIRYCARNFGMNRERLSTNMPILAQLNFDGNCFILMYVAMICIFTIGANIHWAIVLAIAVLVLILELGAPNQPGSILVGTLIIITYLNLPTMLRMAIYLEVIFGSAQNIINVISNIVALAEDEGVRYAQDEVERPTT